MVRSTHTDLKLSAKFYTAFNKALMKVVKNNDIHWDNDIQSAWKTLLDESKDFMLGNKVKKSEMPF